MVTLCITSILVMHSMFEGEDIGNTDQRGSISARATVRVIKNVYQNSSLKMNVSNSCCFFDKRNKEQGFY